MKSLLLYVTKYGGTKRIAERIQENYVCDSYQLSNFDGKISDYDILILGCSIYAGNLHKDFKKFCETLFDVPNPPKVYMFLCGLTKGDNEKVIRENLGNDFFEKIVYQASLGGYIDFDKLNFFEKGIIKMINKKEHLYDKSTESLINLVEEEQVKKFVEEIYNG